MGYDPILDGDMTKVEFSKCLADQLEALGTDKNGAIERTELVV